MQQGQIETKYQVDKYDRREVWVKNIYNGEKTRFKEMRYMLTDDEWELVIYTLSAKETNLSKFLNGTKKILNTIGDIKDGEYIPEFNHSSTVENNSIDKKILGYGLIVFGIIDFLGMYIGYDITGVSWSPILAFLLGSIILNSSKNFVL